MFAPEPNDLLSTVRLLLGIIAIGFLVPTHAQMIEGRVFGISDSDAITVLDPSRMQHKVRSSRIDAHEKQQFFGNVSRQDLPV
ncbi:MAG: hypothetical protein ACREV0_13570 [Burkholderiales bacterium]